MLGRICEKSVAEAARKNTVQVEGQFVDSATKRPPPEREPRSLHVAVLGFLFWTLVDALFTYALFTNVLFRFWVLYHSLLFTFVTWYFGGFQNIQYKMSESLKV